MTTRDGSIYEFWPGGATGDPRRVDLLGGKGAGLARLSLAGFPVPAGFTISSECCGLFVEGSDWPESLETELRAALERLQTRTGMRFASGSPPLLLAVRSGAAVSMPGMMDTILNVGLHPELQAVFPDSTIFWQNYVGHLRMLVSSLGGDKWRKQVGAGKTKDNDEFASPRALEEEAHRLEKLWPQIAGESWPNDPWRRLYWSIAAVFRSSQNERARAYRDQHGLAESSGTAVTVQVMFPAERSGVLFTANPQSPGSRTMVVEASWESGESVVSGAVTPDVYVVDRTTRQIVHSSAGDRPATEPALSASQVSELCDWGEKIEQLLGTPCDIEWGWGEDRVGILQARPIVGLEQASELVHARQSEIERLRQAAGTDRVVWVLHNLAETLPESTPLTSQVMSRLLSEQGGLGQLYRALGFEPARESQSVVEWIAGRPYADSRRLATMFFGRLPLAYDLDALVQAPAIMEGPPGKLEWERMGPLFFLEVPRLAVIWGRVTLRTRRLSREAVTRFESRVALATEQFESQCAAVDLRDKSDASLWEEWCRRRNWVLGELAAESLLPGYLGGLAYSRLVSRLSQVLGDLRGRELAAQLVSGLKNDITVLQNVTLEQVAFGNQSLEAFLQQFGHRGVGEMELARPRWREDPAYLVRRVQRWDEGKIGTKETVAARHAAQTAVRESAEKQLPFELAKWGAASLYESVACDLRVAQSLLPYRETGKYYWLKAYARLREITEEWGRRWKLGTGIYYLTEAEIELCSSQASGDRERILAELPSRRTRWQVRQKFRLPDVIDSRQLNSFTAENIHSQVFGRGVGGADRMSGTAPQTWVARPLSPGIVEGTTIHVNDPHDFDALPIDAVLVCSSTDPGWTPLFTQLRGLIVERGGVLSHGALVARDLGLPAVACDHALQRIPDGARIRLDGTSGRVELVEPPA